jgi:hypothetical protein
MQFHPRAAMASLWLLAFRSSGGGLRPVWHCPHALKSHALSIAITRTIA